MQNLAARLVLFYQAKKLTLATAESCTGGLIAAAITDIPGASAVLECGFVSYANAAKTAMLGVPAGLIEAAGAVSEAVAQRMATGARLHAEVDVAVSVTGIAGPGGGSPEKPLGTVWFGLATKRGHISTHHKVFTGSRASIRQASVEFALQLLLDMAEK